MDDGKARQRDAQDLAGGVCLRRYKLTSPQQWMLPLLLLGFIGLAIPVLNPVFNTNSRWLILLAVASYFFVRSQLLKPLRSDFGTACSALILWCVFTTIWSELPELSALKSLAFFIISVTAMASGMLWVEKHQVSDSLNFLIPLTYLAILAGIFGKMDAGAIVQLNEKVQLFQGAVSGANMFGSMLSMCAPLLIWKVYISNGRIRNFWMTLLFIALYYLLLSKARSSFLCVACTLMFFYMGYSKRNKIAIFFSFTLLATSMYLFFPSLVTEIKGDYINKHGPDEDILYSRNLAWEESYHQALKGGLIGGGYGVTVGDSNLNLGFTVSNYGREKANSQLAIVEETGFVGLVIYAIFLTVLVSTLRRGILSRQAGPPRLQMLLVVGTVVGMLVKSVFEAWWVAPSSPESVYFWALVGVALGICKDPRTRCGARSNQQSGNF